MKRILAVLLLALVLLPATALAAVPGGADDVVSFGHGVTVRAGETVTGVVVFGGSAEIQGTDLGDAVVFGGSVVVDGQVTGNVLSFGGSAHINNSVNGDVVVLGGGPVVRSRIGGNLIAIGGSVRLEDGAEVMGDVFTLGGGVQRSGNAIVHGSVRSGFGLWGGWHFFSRAFSVWQLCSVVFLGMVCFWLFPLATRRVAGALSGNPAKAAIAGLLGYLAIIPAVIVLAITLLGIPLIPLFLLAVLIARLLGQVALALVAGKWLFARLQNNETSEWVLTVVGLLGLGVLTLIPIVGGLASLFYGLVGFGAVILTRFGTRDGQATV